MTSRLGTDLHLHSHVTLFSCTANTLIDLLEGILPGWVRPMISSSELENSRLAMNAAEIFLKIPKILDPEDFVSEHRDEKSVLAYLSYFKDKVGTPKCPFFSTLHRLTVM